MKKIIFILQVLLSVTAFSQVGINTNSPHSSASLDVVSPSKGILYPRIALLNNTDQVTVLSPAKGLVVYNTNTSAAGSNQVLKDNLYFWNGVYWNRVINDQDVYDSIASLKIPKLAGYVYCESSQKEDFPTGDIAVNYLPNSVVSDFNNNQYMEIKSDDTTNTIFKVVQSGTYGFEGFICILMNLSTNDTIHPEVNVQKSTDNGLTWTNTHLAATAEYDTNLTTGLTIPINFTGVISLNANDLFRLVVRTRFPSTSNYSNVNYYQLARSNGLGVRYSSGFKAVYYPL